MLMMALTALVLLSACQSDEAQPDASRDSAEAPRRATPNATPPDSIRDAVTNAVASIDALRSGLATTFDTSNVTKETFQRVCKPVKMQAMATARENGWIIQQLGRKHRNPAHGLDSLAAIAHAAFKENSNMDSMWRRTTMDGRGGWRYFQRITVEPGCLACHGPKENRPDFVTTSYPDDSAYGFGVGDLRGVYAVFVPMPMHSSDANASSGS
jgi:hypothetical protein